MINPLIKAIEAFLTVYNNLPFAIGAFVDLCLVFWLGKSIYSIFRGAK